jgi:beta-glucosidase
MPWRGAVQAILEMWYPGQEGGWATADLLTGRASPGGKLPVTFPARLEDAPARAPGHPERIDPPTAPGMSGTNPDAPPVTFSEGLLTGYRWYDQQSIAPLFPFGHGLSYSTFQYSALSVRRSGDALEVGFTLRNTGPRAADETPQVYLGPIEDPSIPSAPKSLAAFRRIRIPAGRALRVVLSVPARQLTYWSTTRHAWTPAPGNRSIHVCSSSRNCALSGAVPAPSAPPKVEPVGQAVSPARATLASRPLARKLLREVPTENKDKAMPMTFDITPVAS